MLLTVGAITDMEFPARLAILRKEKSLTQKALADAIGIHVSQVQRYESGASQPTLYALRRLAVALGVSADLLLFDKDERGPDDDLRLEFEAAAQLSPEAKQMVREVLRSLLLSYQVRRVVSTSAG